MPGKQAEGENNFVETNEAIATHAYYSDKKNKTGLQDKTVSDLVYRLLDPGAAVPTWKAFATTKYQKTDPNDWGDYINIEMVHNNLHVRLPQVAERSLLRRAEFHWWSKLQERPRTYV